MPAPAGPPPPPMLRPPGPASSAGERTDAERRERVGRTACVSATDCTRVRSGKSEVRLTTVDLLVGIVAPKGSIVLVLCPAISFAVSDPSNDAVVVVAR